MMRIGRQAPTNGARTSRGGFTLIEVVIALVVSSILVLTGRQMLESITEESRRIRQASAAATVEANGVRVLRELVGRLEIGSTVDRGFGGTGRQLTFSSWCEVPAGWLESCRVTIAVDAAVGTHALIVMTRFEARGDEPGARLIIKRDFEYGTLRYLSSASDGGVWFHSWGQGITAPIAIGIITGRDTAIVPIGERG